MDTNGTDPQQDPHESPRAGWLECVLANVLAHRTKWLLLAATAAVISISPAGQLRFDQSIESLYAEDDPQLAAFRTSRELFGGDEFVIVAYEEAQLFDDEDDEDDGESGRGTARLSSRLNPRAAERLQAFAEELGAVDGVQAKSTQHLVKALEPSGVLGRVMKRIDGLRRRVLELVEGVLVGEDRRTVAIVLRLEPVNGADATRKRAVTFAEIRKRAARHQPPAQVVGDPVQVHDMFRYVEEDGRKLFWWSLGLLAAVILVLFRSIRWVLVPLAVVVVAILWTEALLVQSGMQSVSYTHLTLPTKA